MNVIVFELSPGQSEGQARQFHQSSCLFLGLVEPVNVVDNGDGTHTVTYTPSQEGPYRVSVKYADEEIPRR